MPHYSTFQTTFHGGLAWENTGTERQQQRVATTESQPSQI